MKKLLSLSTALALVLFTGWKWLLLPGIEQGRNKRTGPKYPPLSEEAAALHRSLVVGDLHADSFLWARNLENEADYGHLDLPRARRGNLAIQVFTAVTKSPRGQNYGENSSATADNITLLAIVQGWPPRTWNSLLQRAPHYWDAAVCDTSPRGIVKTLRYAIDLLGLGHVALGSDFDGSVATAFDVSELGLLTEEMLRQGFSETEIRKVMGENVRDFSLAQLPPA